MRHPTGGNGAPGRGFRAAGALLLALALLTPTAARADDAAPGARPRIDASVYPWRTFGQLNRQGRGSCTAVLVGRDVALTAAHCLYNARLGQWAAPALLHFVAGFDVTSHSFDSPVLSYQVADGYRPSGASGPPAGAAQDWAVLRLAKPAPARLGYLGVARLAKPQRLPAAAEFDLAGYGRDRPHALSADLACRLIAWETNTALLLHDCRAEHGTSGAPIVRRQGGAYLIYALHVGRTELQERPGEAGVAVPAASFFEAVRTATANPVERGTDGLDILPGRSAE